MTYIGYGVVERWLGNFFTRTEKSIHVVLYYMFESEIKESRKSGGALCVLYLCSNFLLANSHDGLHLSNSRCYMLVLCLLDLTLKDTGYTWHMLCSSRGLEDTAHFFPVMQITTIQTNRLLYVCSKPV